MEFGIKEVTPANIKTACVIACVFDSKSLDEVGKRLDAASDGHLSAALKGGALNDRPGATLMLFKAPGIVAERVLLLSLGKLKEFGVRQWQDAVGSAVAACKSASLSSATLCLPLAEANGLDTHGKLRLAVESAEAAIYSFNQFKSKQDDRKPPILKRLDYYLDAVLKDSGRQVAVTSARGAKGARRKDTFATAIEQGKAIGAGVALTRTLANLPSNVCTPTYLAQQASKMAKEQKLDCEILDKKDMEKLGMGSLLAVARGSHQPPKMIVLSYKGAGKQKPVVLVGKGVTFDSGGISLKPGNDMDEMKYDMSGAASVLGAMLATSLMRLPINLTVVVPATENMPGGNATRPGDIVSSMSGQTIEILNTDAEGRLILCDALTYAERFKPTVVIDVATLTGACLVALGQLPAGLFGTHDGLCENLLAAGEASGDRAWRLPLWPEYQEQLKSNFADMANISSGRWGGAITAAAFLARFTEKYNWAHLDIAGVAWKSGEQKGATGRPAPLLIYYLLTYSGLANKV